MVIECIKNLAEFYRIKKRKNFLKVVLIVILITFFIWFIWVAYSYSVKYESLKNQTLCYLNYDSSSIENTVNKINDIPLKNG
jgi:uncharacterized protein with PQ loop repeat